jgi:hypothetical protein
MDKVAVMKAIPIAGTTSPSRHAVTVPGSHTATIPGSHVPAPRAHAGAAGKRSGTVLGQSEACAFDPPLNVCLGIKHRALLSPARRHGVLIILIWRLRKMIRAAHATRQSSNRRVQLKSCALKAAVAANSNINADRSQQTLLSLNARSWNE